MQSQCTKYEQPNHDLPLKLHGGSGRDFASEMQKRGPENCHRLQCQNLFNVADLVNGM